MVPPDSHGISGVPCYLGKRSTEPHLRLRGYHPLRRPFQRTSTSHRFLTPHQHGSTGRTNAPTTPHTQPLPGITRMRFSLLRFRSPLLSESLLFSLPVGTEMFHFPTFPPHTLFLQAQVTGHDSSWVSPFGHPPDHSSVANSPGLIAGSYVLHRLLMPRHPPCALHSLSHTNTTKTTHHHHTPKHKGDKRSAAKTSYKDARVHYPTSQTTNNHQPTTTTPAPRPTGRAMASPQQNQTTPTNPHTPGHDSSGPNSVPNHPQGPPHHHQRVPHPPPPTKGTERQY